MEQSQTPGQIIILNGSPRSGKSSIAAVIQDTFPGVWMNMGVDRFMPMTPAHYHPGIGLRPGGERPDLEPLIVRLYHAMYQSIAAHSRQGLNVVVDVGHHDDYAMPRDILPTCARIVADLPVLLVGVHCPLATIMARRQATGYRSDEAVFAAVRRWQTAVHIPGIYDLEIDTSRHSPEACGQLVRQRLDSRVALTAVHQLAALT